MRKPGPGLRRFGSRTSLPALVPQSPAATVDLGSHLGVDIGGTLTKMVFLEKSGHEIGHRLQEFLTQSLKYGETGERDSELSVDVEGGRLHFVRFDSNHIVGAVRMIAANGLQQGISMVYTAGGGAHKYAELFRRELSIELTPADELDTVVRGIAWLAEHVEEEIYVFEDGTKTPLVVERGDNGLGPQLVAVPESLNGDVAVVWQPLFPMLVVNIGTGVSIIKVRSCEDFERVSGTALGGGTYWGLSQLLTGCSDFDKAAIWAMEGDASEVNLEVRDIYGGDYELPNGKKLPGNMTASFFAKAAVDGSPGHGAVLRALATMIAQNVCQIALLNARIYDAPHVVFTGNFLRQNPVAIDAISTNFSKVAAVMEINGVRPRSLFLTHEGYFGALGSLLLNWHTASSPEPRSPLKRKETLLPKPTQSLRRLNVPASQVNPFLTSLDASRTTSRQELFQRTTSCSSHVEPLERRWWLPVATAALGALAGMAFGMALQRRRGR